MPTLTLKPQHKAVKDYYREITTKATLFSATHEGAVAPAFAKLLGYCTRDFDLTLIEQYRLRRNAHSIVADGALVDRFKLVHGIWEAKDTADDLAREVQRKFAAGYPRDNILFQAPDRAIIWQNGQEVFDADILEAPRLIAALKTFLEYQPPAYEQWRDAVAEFKNRVPEFAAGLLELIEEERRTNQRFVTALSNFTELCRAAINPNLASAAVEEMLIQHLLTERIFRKVFNNPDFAHQNIIAREIEGVIRALIARHPSRHQFLQPLDRFYGAIETTAATIADFSQKQDFLNTVYEQFFQGFSVKVADTHGIVYTPQPIVEFMVRSVADILQREFGRSLGDAGVHILDPFVGTGNFILRVMHEIPRTKLPAKYAAELHCNEVMLLPYYIAAMNIEHEYYELTGEYAPFRGICLVDTFELAEERQMSFFSQENTARVAAQKAAPIFVIIGNPPYNAGQVNENDNNKNRKYPTMDDRVAETYVADSKATNKNALSDVYVKAFRFASDRIGDEGVVAFVTNSSFIDGIAFDGMRKHLEQDFDAVYILDLGGNVRKNPKLSGTTHNVFGIQVGVSISFLVRKQKESPKQATIYYARVGKSWRKEQKYDFLDEKIHRENIDWREIEPDKKYRWLTKGLQEDFEAFLPIGTKAAKAGADEEVIFEIFSNGVKTNRDAWAYNFDREELARNMQRLIENYNNHVFRWSKLRTKPNIDDFITYDETQISWSRELKSNLQRERIIEFDETNIRKAFHRPFVETHLFFDKTLIEVAYLFPTIFPTIATEEENRVIWLKVGSAWPMFALVVNKIPNVLPQSGSQCFPFYTYDEDGSNRRENITDWALARFRAEYHPHPRPLSLKGRGESLAPSPLRGEGWGEGEITKWDIFHYVYAVLHHPAYREKYAANLRRELPRLPFAPDFWGFAAAGAQLAELHVNYEAQEPYPLEWIENPDAPLDWRVEKMRLSKDKTRLRYNDFLTLAGIPPEVYEYRLGNRAALEWLIDRYRVTTDARSGITNDPNRAAAPRYIVELIGKVITVSLATVKIVRGLPALEG